MYHSKRGDLQQFAYVFAAGLPELLPSYYNSGYHCTQTG